MNTNSIQDVDVNIDSLEKEINNINSKHFNNLFTIEKTSNSVCILYEGIAIRVFWIKKNYIEVDSGGLNWYYWVSYIFCNNLALKFNGSLYNSGNGETKNPSDKQYISFKEYMESSIVSEKPDVRTFLLYSTSLESPVPFKYISDDVAKEWVEEYEKNFTFEA